jgi:hypothetical protein
MDTAVYVWASIVDPTEAQAIVDRLAFKKRHTDDCQTINGVTEWQTLNSGALMATRAPKKGR